ncbi:MAG: NAD(P)/FAD-dependent oxidoreductase, partial [Gemmatimonadales bacterium]
AGLRADWLAPADVRQRWPGVAVDCRGALLAPDDGAVDPATLTRALLTDARRLGTIVIPERVDRLIVARHRVGGVATGGGAWITDHVVIAAGAWSARLPGMPRPVPVEPVRGQLVATAWPPDVPPGILFHHHAYVLARADRAVLGSTMEHVGFDARTSDEGIARVLAGARRLLPPLERMPVVRAWAGLRPVTPDGQPIVGPDPAVAGLWYAVGHGRSGILLAALTGDVIAALLATGSTTVDISPWRPERWDAVVDR